MSGLVSFNRIKNMAKKMSGYHVSQVWQRLCRCKTSGQIKRRFALPLIQLSPVFALPLIQLPPVFALPQIQSSHILDGSRSFSLKDSLEGGMSNR